MTNNKDFIKIIIGEDEFMTIDGIPGIAPVQFDQQKHEDERNPQKKSEALQGISNELSAALADICVWITRHPLASITELNLDQSAEELKDISQRLLISRDDLNHYLGVIPENRDNDIAEDMLHVLEEDLESVHRISFCSYRETSLSFRDIIEKAQDLDLKELSVQLFHLFHEVHESSWKEIKSLFSDLMKKCA